MKEMLHMADEINKMEDVWREVERVAEQIHSHAIRTVHDALREGENKSKAIFDASESEALFRAMMIASIGRLEESLKISLFHEVNKKVLFPEKKA